MKDAIEQLYAVFFGYPLLEHIDGCSHCVFDRDHALIHSVPLRALSDHDLGKYAAKAMTTWGDSRDFRHFLPRLMELHAQSTLDPTNDEITFGKLRYADWHTWPTLEQDAIRAYSMSLWLEVLDARPVDEDSFISDAYSYLCVFSCADEDLEPYLAVWADRDLTFRRDHFDAIVEWFGESIQRPGPLAGGFWNLKPSNQVRQWLMREETWQAFGLEFLDVDQSSHRLRTGQEGGMS
ncbi:MAG: hypothetical protein ABIQ99_00440 [Thermoflexales bacterium]